MTWSNPKVLLTLGLIFVCGVACGSAVTQGYIHSHWHNTPAAVSPDIEKARSVGLTVLKSQLSLTPAQELSVTKILDDYGKFYQNIEDERQDVALDGKRRILEVLTPVQRDRFLKMVSEAAK